LIVEVDGGQHSNDREHDAERTRWLNSQGYQVIRFWNNEVMTNVEGVVERIQEVLRDSDHPKKGGGNTD